MVVDEIQSWIRAAQLTRLGSGWYIVIDLSPGNCQDAVIHGNAVHIRNPGGCGHGTHNVQGEEESRMIESESLIGRLGESQAEFTMLDSRYYIDSDVHTTHL